MKRASGDEESDTGNKKQRCEEKEEETNPRKRVYLCLGEHGYLQIKCPLQVCMAMQETHIIYCCHPIENISCFPHPPDDGEHICITLPVSDISYIDVLQFTKVCNDETLDENADVNYVSVKQMMDWFGAPLEKKLVPLLPDSHGIRVKNCISALTLALDVHARIFSSVLSKLSTREEDSFYERAFARDLILTQREDLQITACNLSVRTKDVDFQNILALFQDAPLDFQTSIKTRLISLLKATPKFEYARAAMSAFKLTEQQAQTNGIPPFCIYETRVKDMNLLDRMKFVHMHHESDFFYKSRFVSKHEVSELLGIEQSILNWLDPQKCVLAGGGCLKLGVPESPFTERCDVDLFVLNGFAEQKKYALQLAKCIQETTQRRVFLSRNSSVITAVGVFGVRRIQIILATQKTPEDLVLNFDVHAVRSYYDGDLFHATIGAQHDWITKKCSTNTFHHLTPKRLFGMHWKGFELTPEAQQFMERSTFGWPVKEAAQKEFEYVFPFLTKDVPEQVQDASLYAQFHLTPLAEIESEDALQPLPFSRYKEQLNIFGKNVDPAYVDTWTFEETEVGKHDGSLLVIRIHTDFVLQLKNCTVNYEQEKNPKQIHITCGHVISKALCSTLAVKAFQIWTNNGTKMIPNNMHQIGLQYTWEEDHKDEWKNIFASIQNCVWQQNGFTFLDSIPARIHNAQILIRPAYFYRNYRSPNVKLRWEATHISWLK